MRYLRLPWPEFGETDALLNLAMDTIAAAMCPCGCGLPKDQAHDEANVGRFQINVQKCYARAALDEFEKDHADELSAHLRGVRLLPEGETASDPLAYSPEKAKAAYDALQKRHGLA